MVRSLNDVELILASNSEPRAVAPAVARVATVSAFEAFYRTNRLPLARALALTLRNTELASDAVDEAMARAYERWSHVEGLANPTGWVYRVALNWSRSFLRRALRPMPAWRTPGVELGSAGLDPTVDRALAELSVEQRAVVVCRLLLGWSEAQTAKALDIRPGTVKSRLNRASARLQTTLGHMNDSQN
jgi:DNA-directed RNA polymerase specialized sigma24 family protein